MNYATQPVAAGEKRPAVVPAGQNLAQEQLSDINQQTIVHLIRLQDVIAEAHCRLRGSPKAENDKCNAESFGGIISQAHEMRGRSGRLVRELEELLELL